MKTVLVFLLAATTLLLSACSGRGYIPTAQSVASAHVPQTCNNALRTSEARRVTPKFTVCGAPSPPQPQPCDMWCGDPNPQLDPECILKPLFHAFDRGSNSCLETDAYVPPSPDCNLNDGWGCSTSNICRNFYAADRQQAPKVILAFINLGSWATAGLGWAMKVPAIAAWIEGATGLPAAKISGSVIAGSIAANVLSSTGGSLNVVESIQIISAWNERTKMEAAYGCIHDPQVFTPV